MKCAISRGDSPLSGLLLFFFLFQFSLHGQGFYVKRVIPLPPEFSRIYAQNQTTVWAVGERGILIKSTDSGVSWLQQTTEMSGTIRCIYFLDDTTGYITGDGSAILYTSNAGQTWVNRISPISGLKLYSIHFADRNTGYITGSGGHIIKTTDGGLTWFRVAWPADADFYGIAFTDTLTGYIMTGSGECYKTTDGGANWILKHTGIFSVYYDLHIINNNLIFLTGTGGSLARSSDGGETWQIIPTGVLVTLNSITFSDSLNGYLGGDAGVLLKTSTGGLTWEQIPSSLSLKFNDVHSPAPGIVYIASEKGWVFRHGNNSGWLEYKHAGLRHFYTVQVLGRNLIQVAGEKGAIYVTSNGGTWINKTIDMNRDLRSMDFHNLSEGWICGDSGVVVQTTDGGSLWNPVATGTMVNLRGIASAGNKSAFAVGENGLIISTSDGGESWITQTSGTENHLNAVAFSDSIYGIAVGSGGTVLITSNRGAEWSLIPQLFSDNLYTVRFGVSSRCVAAGDSGRIIWSIDKGKTWLVNPPVNNYPYRGLSFASPNDVFFASLGINPTRRTFGASTSNVIFNMYNNQFIINAISMFDLTIGAMAANDGVIMYMNNAPGIPVELLSFVAQSSSAGITLEWETATETNNRGFELQRYANDGQWGKLTFVEGTGTTVTASHYIYYDYSPQQGVNRYRLMQTDFDGSAEIAGAVEAFFITEDGYHLGQNYPNPFNPETRISYNIPVTGHVSIVLYDVLGCQAAVLVNEERPAGLSEITFSAERLASGVYYYTMVSGGYTQYRKLVVLK